MAMAVDRQQTQMSNMGYDPSMRYPPPPHFTNPWVSGASQQQLYSTSIAPNVSAGLDASTQRPTSIAIPYHGLQVTAPPLGQGITLPDGTFATDSLPDMSQDLMARGYTSGYAASASPNNQTYAPTSAPYSQVEYGSQDRSSYPYQDASRRSSHPSVPSAFYESLEAQRQRQSSLVDFSRMNAQQPPRSSFSEALDASRGMVSLSQSDITPRNIYGQPRYQPQLYRLRVEGQSVDLASSRTLPRPNALLGASMPPAPQSMMSQFSSKVSSSSQKKHKCKICDKRFTRPSSLQTHMYSHTGEKPFACEVDGCGRHFSVVSNLRRHRKVHKNEGGQDHPSPEDA
ncbi:hypothetical protein SNOG_04235 [Parastagonospora nodorum SN15]|uniref:C2H2-type domain-containing protein n=1 Tax=Phaeosphaeria nodorum (strain SN15 / ATCC MYA-4574 / FGSC 10173) TaxID=321614 RepID=Q0UVH9_PHANO|nr:hypothetical protein SNOG_04235 [Parastagonospora nodorum SN15]EAT87995.2 hypothetical protein SNOG_04235 [Parastagonospora nodorum SN15]